MSAGGFTTNNRRFGVVATGGTFDELHIGHLALLTKAFEVGDKVIIGISSDEFASRVKKKKNLGTFMRSESRIFVTR